MKLNLLPATVSKGAKARTAWIGSVLLILAGVGASAFMISKSRSDLLEIKQLVAEERPKADRAYQTAIQADTIIVKAEGVVRNAKLANAMINHNNKYPALYTELLGKIPSFFRVTQITATPINETTSQINLQGTLETYQQYADLMLALFQFKGTTAVGRNNYVSTEQIVPALTEVDQTARPRRADEAPIPDDAMERLTYFQSQATTPQFTGTGNYGTATDDTRFALPNSSLIQVTMIVSRDLRVPDVRGTLAGGGTAPAPGGFGGGMPPGGVPGGAGRFPGGGSGGPSSPGGPSAGAGDFE
jgi:hypothetical protein